MRVVKVAITAEKIARIAKENNLFNKGGSIRPLFDDAVGKKSKSGSM